MSLTRRAERLRDEDRRVCVHSMTSIFSSLSSLTMFWIRIPRASNARADRVNTLLQRRDGDLRAVPGFARDVLDLDLPVVDFRHFVLEQAAQHVLVRAADDNLRATAVALHLKQQGAHLIVRAIPLLGDLLLARHHCFGAPQAERDRSAGDALHRAGNEVAFALDKLAVERFALGLANTLQDNQLGRRGGAAAEAGARLHPNHHQIAQLGVRVILARLFERDFRLLALDLLDHLFFKQNAHLAGGIDTGFDLLVRRNTRVAPVG